VASLLLASLLLALLALFTPLALPHPAAALLALAGVTTCLLAFGLLLAARLRSAESFRLLAALVTVPLYFLSGIFYPVSELRGPLGWLAYANPLTYGVDLLRYGLLDVAELPPALSATLLALLGVASVALAVRVFARSDAA
jgi:ABC-2 type transport system permease protein